MKCRHWKQKNHVVLIEIFIVIGLFITCAFPIIRSSIKNSQTHSALLLELELERYAELYFYKILRDHVSELDFENIPKKPSRKIQLEHLKVSFCGLDSHFSPYCYFYCSPNAKNPEYKMVWCQIYFQRNSSAPFCPSFKYCFFTKKRAKKNNKEDN